MSPELVVGEAAELGFSPEQIADYVARTWSRRIALAIPEFYRWQFLRSPTNAGADRCVLLARREGEILGFMGLHQRPFALRGQRRAGAELTTWMISPEAQGIGNARRMLEFLQGRYDVLLGMGLTDAAVPPYLNAGFRYVRAIPRFVRVLRPERVGPLSELDRLGRHLLRKRALVDVPAVEGERVEDPGDAIDYAAFHARANGFSRDPEFLAWRYLQHPVYRYDLHRVRRGEARALLVTRLDSSPSLNVLHVVDVIGDPAAYPTACLLAERLAIEAAADLADLYSMHEELANAFWLRGWFSILQEPFVQVPHLFYPLEMRVPPTTSLIAWTRSDADDLFALHKLQLTKGDCDLDRPTLAYLEHHGIAPSQL